MFSFSQLECFHCQIHSHEELVALSIDEVKYLKKTGVLHVMYRDQLQQHDKEFGVKNPPECTEKMQDVLALNSHVQSRQ